MPEKLAPREGTFWTLQVPNQKGDAKDTVRFDNRVMCQTRREALEFAHERFSNDLIQRGYRPLKVTVTVVD